MSLEPPGRAGRREAASSVAPIVELSTLPAFLPRDAHRTRVDEASFCENLLEAP